MQMFTHFWQKFWKTKCCQKGGHSVRDFRNLFWIIKMGGHWVRASWKKGVNVITHPRYQFLASVPPPRSHTIETRGWFRLHLIQIMNMMNRRKHLQEAMNHNLNLKICIMFCIWGIYLVLRLVSHFRCLKTIFHNSCCAQHISTVNFICFRQDNIKQHKFSSGACRWYLSRSFLQILSNTQHR